MEIRIVIFLAFVSVTVVTNTLLLLFAYKLFSNVTSRVTETVAEFSKMGETREWIDSLQVAAEQAAQITEATKLKMEEFDPVLSRAQENYRRTLSAIDSKLETFAGSVDTTAQTIRDVVAKPAFAVVTFAAGITKVLEEFEE